jgi:hypothetical protein
MTKASEVAELQAVVAKQQKLIEYMRSTVKSYIDIYMCIGQKLEEADNNDVEESEVMAELDDVVMQCHDLLQPVITLWEDTKPENIDETLAGHSISQMQRVTSFTLN